MVKIGLTIASMRRSLVLTDERSRHPFRAYLPERVVLPGRVPLEPQSRGWLASQLLREFLMAYSACFVAVSLFIA